ncbi:hypothetical protein [Piscinibacter sakaiensis]|uniref:hypothetical protein n=1 Tax=Piscinibacter sakaiensis TaxID=1547922 RepID=UPI00372D0CE7
MNRKCGSICPCSSRRCASAAARSAWIWRARTSKNWKITPVTSSTTSSMPNSPAGGWLTPSSTITWLASNRPIGQPSATDSSWMPLV